MVEESLRGMHQNGRYQWASCGKVAAPENYVDKLLDPTPDVVVQILLTIFRHALQTQTLSLPAPSLQLPALEIAVHV